MGDARVGFALTGSFCTLEKAIRAMEETAREYPNMVPILSETTGGHRHPVWPGGGLPTGGGGNLRPWRGGVSAGGGAHRAQTAAGCAGHRPLHRQYPGQIGQRHCRYLSDHGGQGAPAERPACGGGGVHQRRAGRAARNIGELLCRKHYYFVPFRQDDPVGKPTSLVADMTKVTETVTAALRGRTATAPAPGAGGPVKQSPAGIDLPGFAVGVLGKHSTVRRLPWGRGWGIMGPETPRRRKKKPWRIM